MWSLGKRLEPRKEKTSVFFNPETSKGKILWLKDIIPLLKGYNKTDYRSRPNYQDGI
jgi:hypothetical protein